MQYSNEEREVIIDRLNRSFLAMPDWVKTATIHSMGAPAKNPETGLLFTSFKEVLDSSSNETLESLLKDIEINGDLVD